MAADGAVRAVGARPGRGRRRALGGAQPGPFHREGLGTRREGGTYRHKGGRWESRAPLAGRPEALLAARGLLVAATATEGGTEVPVSSDGGRSWRLRYSPPTA